MASVPYYDHIVVGCGGVGSAALYWLSRRAGKGVLGLEQFKLGHDNGGSQDHSRIIWEEVEKESGLKLLYKTGGLDFTLKGPLEEVMEDYAKAMDSQGIPYERQDGPEIHRRFPQFEVGPETVGLYQPDGGLVDAARGNAAHIQLARAHGATVMDECAVLGIERLKSGLILVRTEKGEFRCRRVVVCAGAWVNDVLRYVGTKIPISVSQEQVTYFATPNINEFTKDRFPIWLYFAPDYILYGLPIHGNTGSKIGIDYGRTHVTPGTRTYTPDPVREKASIEFLQKYIPRVGADIMTSVFRGLVRYVELTDLICVQSLGPVLYTKTCLYTVTMDRNFVLDTLDAKGWPEIIVCCGAGHAYKFAGLLGKILSQLAIDGRTQHPIDDFTFNRPAVTDPNFKLDFYLGGNKEDTLKAKL
ncbi:PIPOX [Branchiostoma lanceolatum]|uniref:PIPOX protein n=1 Tax=Branchiostoma lanceolatum TaxID=7740 RepID=A0A8J9ZXV5_BRALA|nr:PIPOX [Branchiostoma lanceolatum]